MAVLTFTLHPDAVGKFYDAFICLGKFSEAVSFEASKDNLVLKALNSTKSAYASFTFTGSKIFSKYAYTPYQSAGQQALETYACRLNVKALIPVFKGRVVDPQREKDTSIERCDVSIVDGPEESESRFVVKMNCRNGVLKVYRLTFEAVQPMRAMFREEQVKNRWQLSSRTLRELVEHFEPKTEQLDIFHENGRANFMSYTEKIADGNAILKQPLQTTIALDIQEFGGFEVDKRLHIVISVKDFKAIMMHAGTSNTIVSAAYSSPFQPMRLRYDYDGFSCEFILQTIGDARGQSTTPAPRAVGASQARSLRKLPVEPMPNRPASSASAAGSMAPPSRSAAPSLAREAIRARNPAPSPPQPQPSQHDNLLFVPEDDDDRRWDPADEGDEDVLGWDASADNNIARPTIQPSGQALRSQQQNDSARPNIISAASQHIHPTQRMSQIRGIFDD